MILSDLSIRRPVLATVVNLIIVLVGLIAWDRLTIREFPNVDDPVVTITTNYLGANAEIIESQVTKPLEDGISGIEGIDYISSISRAEQSQISVRFSTDRDPDAAANDVRDRVARARSFLPKEIDNPIVAKVESDATPIIYMAINSDRHNEMELTDYADRVVKDRLEVLPGVAQMLIIGERRYSMRVWLDRGRLAAYSLTPADVEHALTEQNVEVPAGRIESSDREFTVLSETDLKTPPQFSQIILKDAGGYLVRLGDVAHVEVGPELVRNMSRASGHRAIGLGLDQAVHLEPARRRARTARRTRRGEQGAARRHARRHRLRLVDFRAAVDRPRVRDHPRSDRAGRVRDLPVPAQLARHTRAVGHDPDCAGRRDRADVGLRLLDQHADAAGVRARDRPGRGRRDRDAREHLPLHRTGHGPDQGGVRRFEADRFRDRRDDVHARGGVHADRVQRGQDRASSSPNSR